MISVGPVPRPEDLRTTLEIFRPLQQCHPPDCPLEAVAAVPLPKGMLPPKQGAGYSAIQGVAVYTADGSAMEPHGDAAPRPGRVVLGSNDAMLGGTCNTSCANEFKGDCKSLWRSHVNWAAASSWAEGKDIGSTRKHELEEVSTICLIGLICTRPVVITS